MHDFIIEDELRIASAQQRAFWLANEIDPGTPAFNLLRVLRIKGVVHKDILANAFNEIVARHEVLRTGLVERNGAVRQRVHSKLRINIEEQDLTSLPEAERDAQAEALAVQMCQMAFDLASPPHFRAALVRLSDEEQLLVIVFHHAIIDGWSMGPFFDELACLYDAGLSGKPALLPDLPIQYREFAEQQENLHAQPTFEKSIAFWRTTLAGAPPVLTLPTTRPRSAVRSHHGARLSFEIDTDLAEAFRALCARHGATLFMGLFSAFQILLQRWADTDDLVIGTPVSGSRNEELAPLVGCFVNTLAMRADLSGNPTFAALLARNRSASLEAFEHQEVPFEDVVAELGCPRTRDHSPLFQAMFVLQNFGHQAPQLTGLQIEEMDVDRGIAQLDLTLEIIEGDALTCSFEYDSELFDRPMVVRMASHFQRILQTAIANPEQPISTIRLLEKGEWDQAVFGWNATRREYPQRTLPEAFAAISAERFNEVALISGDRRITFGQLAQHANQVAAILRSHAASAAEPVAIFMPRSAEAFAAVLGCIIAGIPWVPLDAAQPDRRLAQLIDLAGCRTVLTLRFLTKRLPESLTTVLMDRDAPLWSTPVETTEVSPADIAYVLFTSGSTGVPKGVMGTTRALMNRINWMHEAYPFVQGEVACCKTSIGFVDSVWEMLGPLLAGVPTVIVPDETVLDPEAFITLLGNHGVTRIVLVPTLLRVLLDHAPDLGQRLPDLNMWSVSGETFTADLAKRFKLACPGRKLINLYGSSEVAADVLVHEVEDEEPDGSVPIGKPIANTQVYILDRTGQPAPVGLPGVIHAGGDCLAMGYWGKPELTAERFRANPIPGAPSPLLFNTGDRGVWRADGAVLYLGRTDNQVKLRGVRLELGEILTMLRGHASVRNAAVAIVGEGDRQRLVAFIVGQQDQKAPVPAELRAYLQERLPPVAIPARLLVVDELPLLPSGKVDQVALIALADAPARQEPESKAVPVNANVAQIWRAVLREDELDAADDFFDLGGNSLLAMQVIVRVRRQFGIDIAIRTLFDNPTLGGFSRAVEATAPADDAGLREIKPRARSRRELGELRERLADLSPAELDALIRSVRPDDGEKTDGTAVPEQPKEKVPSLTETQRHLAEIWKDLLGLDKVETTDDFFELGGHSLLALRLLAAVEKRFGRNVDLATLFESPTIESFALALEQRDDSQFDFRRVVRLWPQSTKPQIFAINSTGAYFHLAKLLGPERPLTALQIFNPSLPVERMPDSIEGVAAQYVQLIRQLQPNGPYRLLSWCAGGILTSEIAHQLLSANQEVSFLALIEAYAPVRYERFGRIRSLLATNSFRLQWNVAEFGKVMRGEQSPVKFLTYRQSLQAVARAAKAFRFSRPQEKAADYELWLMTEYLAQLARKYSLKRFPGRIHLFRATRMPKGLFLDDLNGWGAYTAGGVELAFVEGDHHSIFRPPGVHQIAEKIATALET